MPHMLPVILKNLFTGVATKKYPKVKRKLPENVRGHIEFDQKACVFCGSCERKCPAAAIDVKIKKELIFYLDRCVVCGICIDSCAKKAISMSSEWSKPFCKKPVLTFSAPPKEDEPKKDESKKEDEPKKDESKEK